MASEEPSKARKTAAGIVGALLAGVVVVGSVAGSAADAASLEQPVADALAGQGLSGFTATLAGREATLSGPAAHKDAAIAAAQGVTGVRWATYEEGATAAPEQTPGQAPPDGQQRLPSIAISGTDAGTTLTGSVPSPSIAQQLEEQAGRVFGAPVTNSLTVDPDLADPSWLTGLTGLLPSFPTLTKGSLALSGPDGLTLTGQAPDQASVDALKADVAAALPGIDAAIDLSVATPAASPDGTPSGTPQPSGTPIPSPSQAASPSLTIDATGGGGATVSGTVPDADAEQRILAAAAAVFGEPVTNRLTVDAASGGSAWLPALIGALPTLPEITGGRLVATGDRISLTGTVDSTTAADSASALLRSAVTIPASVTLTAPSPTPTPQAVPASVIKALNGTTVRYATASYQLTEAARHKLDAAIEQLTEHPSIKVQVTGYVSLPHNPKTITSFSKSRAKAVKDYLVAGGIDASRISVVGKGAADPVASNDTESGRLKNQRATLTVKES